MNKNLLNDAKEARAAYNLAMHDLREQGPDLVRSIRYKNNLTQKELAEKLGVHCDYISHIEAGRRILSWRLVDEILRLFTDHV